MLIKEPFDGGYIEVLARTRGNCHVIAYVLDPRKKKFHKPKYWWKSGPAFVARMQDIRAMTSYRFEYCRPEMRPLLIKAVQRALDALTVPTAQASSTASSLTTTTNGPRR